MSGLFNSDAVNELLAFFKGRNEGLSAIGQTTLTGSVASVTFDLTDYQQFRHLLLVANARTDVASGIDVLNIRFNADAAGNYDNIYVLGTNSITLSAYSGGATSINAIYTGGSLATANNFGGGFTLFNNYSNVLFRKTTMSLSVNMSNQTAANARIITYGGAWRNTAAITSILLFPGTGPNFVANSTFALYGIY